jgi:hypothetical protein
MKRLEKLSLGSKLPVSEQKKIVGGAGDRDNGKGSFCKCSCSDKSGEWIAYGGSFCGRTYYSSYCTPGTATCDEAGTH